MLENPGGGLDYTDFDFTIAGITLPDGVEAFTLTETGSFSFMVTTDLDPIFSCFGIAEVTQGTVPVQHHPAQIAIMPMVVIQWMRLLFKHQHSPNGN